MIENSSATNPHFRECILINTEGVKGSETNTNETVYRKDPINIVPSRFISININHKEALDGTRGLSNKHETNKLFNQYPESENAGAWLCIKQIQGMNSLSILITQKKKLF